MLDKLSEERKKEYKESFEIQRKMVLSLLVIMKMF